MILACTMMLASGNCPSNCHCSKYKTFCSLARLGTIPSELQITTLLLRIQLDNISQITNIRGLHNLTHMELNKVQLKKILPEAFRNISKLQQLAITFNNISVLERNSFKYLNDLYFLNLSNNIITNLEQETFSGLINLRIVDLSYNKIKQLKANAFEGMSYNADCNIINNFELEYFSVLYSVEPLVLKYFCQFTYFSIGYNSKHLIPSYIPFGMTISKLSWNQIIIYKNIHKRLSGMLYLDMSNGHLKNLQAIKLHNLSQLLYYDLSNNYFKIINSGNFKGLISLKTLKLNHNYYLTYLSNSSFNGLESLEILEISQCSIQTIEINTFDGLFKLRILDISWNNLHNLNNSIFSKLQSLKELKLENNKILNIDTGAFSYLNSLKILMHILTRNPFAFGQTPTRFITQCLTSTFTFPNKPVAKEAFKIFRRLDSLSLTASVSLPYSMQVLKSLQLYLDGGSINPKEELISIMLTVRYIKDLNITLLRINSTDYFTIFSEFHVSNLIIACSDFNIFDKTFIGLSMLKYFTIQELENTSIKMHVFSNMKSLIKLEIYYKYNLTYSRGSFYGLNNLRSLYIQCQTLKARFIFRKIPSKCIDVETFQGLHNLTQLNLEQNKLTCINPGAFIGLKKIQSINLSRNKINKINAGVFGALCKNNFKMSCINVTLSEYCNSTNALKTIEHLNLAINNITYIHPHSFIWCNNMQTLDLSANILLNLDSKFLYTPALKVLDMHDCNISNIINNTFECAPLLFEIQFSSNSKIINLNVNSLTHLKYLKSIDLSHNSILCDCELYDTWFWTKERNIILKTDHYKSGNSSYCGNRNIDELFSNINCNNKSTEIQVKKSHATIKDEFAFFKEYIEPILLIIILILGLLCNFFLLYISFRHSDLRTKQNACVIHLAFADILCLLLNLPLSYWDNFKSLNKICKLQTIPTAWLLMMTWISAIVTSFPAYYSATVEIRCLYCPPGNQDYIQNVWTFQFIVYCLGSAIVIAFFNIKTSSYLKESICRIPGEIKDNVKARNRKMAADTVFILVTVFFISYLPNYILRVLVAWNIVDIENIFIISFFTFCLFFCNSLFNPISLFHNEL
ncbi:hypothetical protein L9F63_017298 [Diploptera punctata]|uniref:G-protein coupled receptors family 1 profile domain-containing protein n=1 Tax=Diploptera punctata TaxID=6984 RepID=A0AAD8EGP7_DIPPU|nr:hypothetical protein L9F63_017298 [Diploptera punctata]